MNKLKTWFRNSLTFHHRIMMRYLQKRGWVVFYLEEQARTCNGGVCWLSLYQSQEGTKSATPNYQMEQADGDGSCHCQMAGGENNIIDKECRIHNPVTPSSAHLRHSTDAHRRKDRAQSRTSNGGR